MIDDQHSGAGAYDDPALGKGCKKGAGVRGSGRHCNPGPDVEQQHGEAEYRRHLPTHSADPATRGGVVVPLQPRGLRTDLLEKRQRPSIEGKLAATLDLTQYPPHCLRTPFSRSRHPTRIKCERVIARSARAPNARKQAIEPTTSLRSRAGPATARLAGVSIAPRTPLAAPSAAPAKSGA
jgi:hypothetical protein